MVKCLYSFESDDAISQFRASNFKPVPEFKTVISDFDNMYESYQNSPSLFTVIGSEELILIAEASRLNLIIEGVFESWEMYEDIHSKMEELRNHLKKKDVSELSVEIICEMIKNESFTLDILVRMIAQPGQTINIQYTNITYGNTEFNVVT